VNPAFTARITPAVSRRFFSPGARPTRAWPEKPNREQTTVKNSPYLDQPFVPLAVALRSMLTETEAKIARAAPADKARLHERAKVLREWLIPKLKTPFST
jgi:hypothetical protein